MTLPELINQKRISWFVFLIQNIVHIRHEGEDDFWNSPFAWRTFNSFWSDELAALNDHTGWSCWLFLTCANQSPNSAIGIGIGIYRLSAGPILTGIHPIHHVLRDTKARARGGRFSFRDIHSTTRTGKARVNLFASSWQKCYQEQQTNQSGGHYGFDWLNECRFLKCLRVKNTLRWIDHTLNHFVKYLKWLLLSHWTFLVNLMLALGFSIRKWDVVVKKNQFWFGVFSL